MSGTFVLVMNTNGRPKAELVLTDEERETLTRWASRPTSAQRLAKRAAIVLRAADGALNKDVAADLHGGLDRLELWHAVENVASCRVAEAAGFAYELTARRSYRYGDGLRHDIGLQTF